MNRRRWLRVLEDDFVGRDVPVHEVEAHVVLLGLVAREYGDAFGDAFSAGHEPSGEHLAERAGTAGDEDSLAFEEPWRLHRRLRSVYGRVRLNRLHSRAHRALGTSGSPMMHGTVLSATPTVKARAVRRRTRCRRRKRLEATMAKQARNRADSHPCRAHRVVGPARNSGLGAGRDRHRAVLDAGSLDPEPLHLPAHTHPVAARGGRRVRLGRRGPARRRSQFGRYASAGGSRASSVSSALSTAFALSPSMAFFGGRVPVGGPAIAAARGWRCSSCWRSC